MGMANDMGMKMKSNGSHSMMMGPMQMYFEAGEKVTILFKQWKTHDAKELIASCFALFVLAIIYEGLKVYRQILLARTDLANDDVYTNTNCGNITSQTAVITIGPQRKRLCSLAHLIQTILHTLQVFIGYLLMLAFMTYNCWICIALLLGSGMGYFLFGWRTPNLSSSGDHCN